MKHVSSAGAFVPDLLGTKKQRVWWQCNGLGAAPLQKRVLEVTVPGRRAASGQAHLGCHASSSLNFPVWLAGHSPRELRGR